MWILTMYLLQLMTMLRDKPSVRAAAGKHTETSELFRSQQITQQDFSST